MHMVFVLYDRIEYALHVTFFCSGKYRSATHIAFFYAGNMPYASRLRMFFGRGLENPAGLRLVFIREIENRADLRFIFIRGMGNRVGIGPRFVRGMDFWVGMGFIRPLAWPFVGRMQYAPTLTDEILSIFLPIRPLAWPPVGCMLLRPTRIIKIRPGIGFVFRGVAEKGAGRGLCEKWGRRASIIIRRLLPLRARRRMRPIIAPAHAFIIPNYVA